MDKLEKILEIAREEWIKIDETSWNERSQHPSPLVMCDFTDKQIKQAYLQGIRDAKGFIPKEWPEVYKDEQEARWKRGYDSCREETLEAITRLEEGT